MAGSIRASDLAIVLRRDGGEDRLVDADHRLHADGLLEGRHDHPLLDVLVLQVGAGERRDGEVHPVHAVAGVGGVEHGGLLGQRDEVLHAGLEHLVVDSDPGGQVRELPLEHGLDGRVLVLGVVDQEGHGVAHVAGQPGPGDARGSGRGWPPR